MGSSIVLMVGMFVAVCIGIHTGQEGTDEEWIESAKRGRPILKKEALYEVKCIGGDE